MRFPAHLLLIALAVLPRLAARRRRRSAAAITEQNLLESERYWPYHVGLDEAVRGAEARHDGRADPRRGLRAWRASTSGATACSRCRSAATDLVERANRVRRGELAKRAPELRARARAASGGHRSATPRPFSFERAGEQRSFLAVFADPGAEGFAELAKALAPLAKRDGLLTILLPARRAPGPRGVREAAHASSGRCPSSTPISPAPTRARSCPRRPRGPPSCSRRPRAACSSRASGRRAWRRS